MTAYLEDEIKKAKALVEDKYKNTIHENRLVHILGVAKTAKKLALKYGVSPEKAYLAGLLHDYYRYEDEEVMQKELTKEEIEECEQTKVLYHAYASSAFYLKHIGSDPDIAYAIKYHTFGRLPMSRLAEIILLSDYIEPSRKYPDCIACRKYAQKGLFNTAIYYSTYFTINQLKKEGMTPHPYQVEMLNYYKDVMILELLDILKEALDKVRASNVCCYDAREVSPFYDYIVLATVNTTRQSEALRSYLEDYLVDTPFKIRGEEGANTNWYLIDLNTIIVSLLTSEERERLDLDNLYSNLNEVGI